MSKLRTGSSIGTVSVALMMAVTLLIQPWEGRQYVAYRDIGGVWTVCDGHTGPDIIIGKTYTDAECDQLTIADARIAAAGVDRYLLRPVPVETRAAFISFAFNVGAEAFRKSTLLRLANAGDIAGACHQLSRWVYVKGVVVKGLQNRRYLGDKDRISERELCLMGVTHAG